MSIINNIRNIAIIAHVDHGKTTLIDKLLEQTGTLDLNSERIMDSNDLEKERGITITAKNTAITWQDYRINIVDTPGHADFGGEVERILSMVDSVLLLVDAVEGPMPQTRFVTQKAFEKNLHPIVVINKIDRPGARPEWVENQIFELFDELGATEEQLDFQLIYASGINGKSTLALDKYDQAENLDSLLETIVGSVKPPNVNIDGPFQMQISALDYSTYKGTIGIGRITRGAISTNTPIKIIGADGEIRTGKISQILRLIGVKRDEIPNATAGDIVAITGIETLNISDTICDPNKVEALPALKVDKPIISMMFGTNTSPFAGKEGKFVTSRKLRERLDQELKHNVALNVEDTDNPDKFKVSGRGELHLSILIETMRREGYELGISKPEIIIENNAQGEPEEPYERLTLNIPIDAQGKVMERLGDRRGDLLQITPDLHNRIQLDYSIPTRGIIGFHTEFMTLTAGQGLMYHVFEKYGKLIKEKIVSRKQGVLISNDQGTATAYALWNLQARGKLIIKPQTEVYEGMVIGIHTRDNDLVVNVIKGKQLTNMRAAGKDEQMILSPPVLMSLEESIDFINEDELLEVTPENIRIRKKYLKEHERRREDRQK